MMGMSHWNDAIVTIDAGSADSFLRHLLRLDQEARLRRFCHPASDACIRAYVDDLDLTWGRVIGFFQDGEMRGAAELSPSGSARAPAFEATFSVEQDWQRRGIGKALFLRAISVARRQGASHILVGCLAGNESMQRIVAQFDAELLLDDDDCRAWLPLGRTSHGDPAKRPAQSVRQPASPSS